MSLEDIRPATIELQWERPEDPGAVATRILRRDSAQEGDDADWEPIADVSGDRLEVPGALPWRSYRFAAAPVYADGSVAPRSQWTELSVTVDAEAPPLPDTPQNFGAIQQEALVHFEWTPNLDGVTVGYEIRRGVWADGIFVGRTVHPFFEAPWWDPGTRTYFMAAIDALGRYGATAQCSVQVKALPDHVTTNTFSESGGGFAGSKTNTEVSGGSLILKAVPSPITSETTVIDSATYPAWSRYWHTGTYVSGTKDLGVLGLHRIDVRVEAGKTTAGSLVIDDYGCVIGTPERDGSGQWSDPTTRGYAQRYFASGDSIDALGILVEIDTTPDSGGSPSWDGYRRYIPGEFYARQIRFRVTMTGDGFMTPSISSFIFYHRQKNLKDEGSISVAGTPGPTAITFTTGFTGAPKVVATVLDAAGTEFVALAADITTSGANLRAYDAAGAEVFTGTIHWIAAGV